MKRARDAFSTAGHLPAARAERDPVCFGRRSGAGASAMKRADRARTGAIGSGVAGVVAPATSRPSARAARSEAASDPVRSTVRIDALARARNWTDGASVARAQRARRDDRLGAITTGSPYYATGVAPVGRRRLIWRAFFAACFSARQPPRPRPAAPRLAPPHRARQAAHRPARPPAARRRPAPR